MKDNKQAGAHSAAANNASFTRRTALALGGAFGLSALAAFGQPGRGYAQGRPSLKIGMANSFMSVTYPYVTNAQAMGFFDKEGVDVDIVMGQGSPQILSLLVAKTVDLVFCNPEPVIQLVADRGEHLKSVFPVIESQYILAVPSDSPIKTVKDLKGKRLGMFGPQSGIDYLLARLQDVGLTIDDIEIVPTGFGAQVILAVKNKQVDAIMYWSDALALFRYSGLDLRELPKGDWEHGMYQYTGTTRDDVIASKPEALRRALRAMAEGQMMSVIAPEMTVEAYWKQYPDQAPKPADRKKSFAQNLYRVHKQNGIIGVPKNATKEQLMSFQWGNQDLDAWRRIQEKLLRVKSLKNKNDPSLYFSNQFLEYANGFDRNKLYEMAKKGM